MLKLNTSPNLFYPAWFRSGHSCCWLWELQDSGSVLYQGGVQRKLTSEWHCQAWQDIQRLAPAVGRALGARSELQ